MTGRAVPLCDADCPTCGRRFTFRRQSKPNVCCSYGCAQLLRIGVKNILDQYEADPNSGCWLWTGATNGRGYGAVRLGGRIVGAHRAWFERAHGPIPSGKVVRHRCDTPLCVNPQHLISGDQRDNVADMDSRGRRGTLHGEANARHRFSDEEVAVIRARLDSGERQVDVALSYGVRRSTIQNIGCGRSRSLPTRAPVPPTDRRAMTGARRQRLIAAHGDQCAYPQCEVRDGLEIDHTIALALGGPDSDANCRPLCRAHHLQKTKLDQKLIAKAKRLLKRADGTRRPRKAIPQAKNPWPKSKRPLQSRPFNSGRGGQS